MVSIRAGLSKLFTLMFKKRLELVLIGISLLSFMNLLFLTLGELAILDHTKIDDPEQLVSIVIVALAITLYLGAIVFQKLSGVWIRKRHGLLGSKLQSRMITIFAIITIIPTVLSSTSSIIFLRYKVQSWFDSKIHMAFEESIALSEKYMREVKRNVVSDAISLSNALTSMNFLYNGNQQIIQAFLQEQSNLRGLAEIVVFQPDKILAKSMFSFSLDFELISIQDIEKANNGEIVVSVDTEHDKIRALLKLKFAIPTYLIIGHLVDEHELNHITTTKNIYNSYQNLEKKISTTQLEFLIMFALTSCLLLLSSMLIGIMYANKIVTPMIDLFKATKRIEQGDLSIKVTEGPPGEEITTLSKAFNRMTSKLREQKEKLLKAYDYIDNRRALIEAILTGVSSGVISTDTSYRIILANECAKQILQFADCSCLLTDIAPEIIKLIEENKDQENINLMRNTGVINLSVKIKKLNTRYNMYIITFDDISELTQTQKTAAWTDVARMIAHEILNPITPMYLAAEKLSKTYSKYITDDVENYLKYTEIIKKHVMNVKDIVTEFVRFAKMPKSVLEKCDIKKLISDIVFSERLRDSTIEFRMKMPNETLYISGDNAQLTNVLMNLIKNSKEALTNRDEKFIEIELFKDNANMIIVRISDSGGGFPVHIMDKLTQPYITTRKSGGTGLGLAIVQKIIDEHKGRLTFLNTVYGAQVEIKFPEYSKEQIG